MKDNKRTLLDKIENIGNKLPHPVVIFMGLSVGLVFLSWILAVIGVETSYTGINMATGEVEVMSVQVNNLLSVAGVEYMLTTAISNFTGFAPLGAVLIAMLGIGIADGSGLLKTALKHIVTKTPPSLLTSVVVFVGILSCLASDAGYVIIIPLAAIVFKSVGRHPIAGLSAGFAGVSGGYGASLLLSPIDAMMAGLTTEAAQIADPNYVVGIEGNWYFGMVSVVLLTILGTIVTERIVEPRLGVYNGEVEEDEELSIISKSESRGLKFATVALIASIVVIFILLLPSGAPLRGTSDTGNILTSPFMRSLEVLLSLLFAIIGIAYGVGNGSIKTSKEIVSLMEKAIGSMSGFIVMAFFAAQFVSYFTYTNLGTIISVFGAELILQWNIGGIPLILTFMVVVMILNFLVGSMSAKWAILGPIFIPMTMSLGYSPEVMQAAYRAADSTTNIISPLMAYFPLIVVFFKKYDKEAGVGSLISTMMPYTVVFTIGWTVLLIIWYIFGLSLGPGTGIYL